MRVNPMQGARRRNHTPVRRLAGEFLEQRRLLAADMTFAPPVAYLIGDNPEHVTVADINGDGNADILTANFFSNDVSILLGNGDGTFGDESYHRASSGAVGIAVADLDGDTILDLAVANLNDNSVSVLMGLGNAAFARRVDYATGIFPESVAAADLDNDGNVDLMVPHTGLPNEPGGLTILMGTGDGRFAPAVEFVEDLRPSFVQVADLDGDSILDIVLANGFGFIPGNDDIAVLLGKGDGTFDAPNRYFTEDGGLPIDIAIADFNGDQILDVGSVNSSSNNVSVLMGVGDGTLATAETYDVPGIGFYASITSGDMNGDNAKDLIVTTRQSIAILINSGDGTFGEPIGVPIIGGPSSVTVADFNQDGRLDIAAAIQGDVPQESVVEVSLNTVMGDSNSDGILNSADIDFLYMAIAAGSDNPAFDLNTDGTLTDDDVRFLVEEILKTKPGDANLDGKVNLSDFLNLSNNVGARDASWSQGDFDGDGEVAFADFLLLANNFGFGAQAAALAGALEDNVL